VKDLQHRVQSEGAEVDGDYARVIVVTAWQGLKNDGKTIVRKTGSSIIYLQRSPYSGWDVIQAEIPGWKKR
jgi:hypothetical protein